MYFFSFSFTPKATFQGLYCYLDNLFYSLFEVEWSELKGYTLLWRMYELISFKRERRIKGSMCMYYIISYVV